jgi:uncharacterized protein YbaP (TraB family)
MMRRLQLALALVFAIAAAVPLHAQAAAKHIMYRVRGPNGATVYLLGSVHLLTPEAGKIPSVVDSAFAHAKTIAFETSLDTVMLRATEMAALARTAPGTTLRSMLSPATAAHADSVLHLYGFSLDQVAAFKPWFVSVLLTQLTMQKAGFQADYGVDMQINKMAKAANKPVIGLESVDFQLHLFDNLPPAAQDKMLAGAKGPVESLEQLTTLKDAWLAGSETRLDSLMNSTSEWTPEMLDMMVVQRNRSWIPKIEELLKGNSDALVVVGAAHLVGKSGVVQMLRAKGYTVEQL